MGCFDEVAVNCPMCGARLVFQSKADECLLETYSLLNMPPRIAGDLDGATKDCKCGGKVTIHVSFRAGAEWRSLESIANEGER